MADRKVWRTPEHKKFMQDLHDKYYGHAKKVLKDERGEIAVAMRHHSKGASKYDLMMEAKRKGIKNFRILNKTELTQVLDDNTSEKERERIVAEAILRWKKGWSK